MDVIPKIGAATRTVTKKCFSTVTIVRDSFTRNFTKKHTIGRALVPLWEKLFPFENFRGTISPVSALHYTTVIIPIVTLLVIASVFTLQSSLAHTSV